MPDRTLRQLGARAPAATVAVVAFVLAAVACATAFVPGGLAYWSDRHWGRGVHTSTAGGLERDLVVRGIGHVTFGAGAAAVMLVIVLPIVALAIRAAPPPGPPAARIA